MDPKEAEFLHRPNQPNGAGLVLTHGAGGNCRAPLLIAVADAFCAAGVYVTRYDLPFRRRRPFGPPSPATSAADRAGLREAVEAMRAMVPGPVFLGGHSYGGRQATMLAAEEPELAARLLLLSYPLHPPKKPEQLRTAHFPALRTPAMFIHGTRDDFGSVEEMAAALQLIPARTSLVPIQGAGHDLRGGKFDAEHLVVRPFLSAE
jgi:predicted alpha/beta-hydrolase family hydrolase